MATFQFNVTVTDDNSGEPIFIGYRPVELTEKDLKAAAAAMESKGGLVTSTEDLGNLDDTIMDAILEGLLDVDELASIENWDHIYVDYDKDIQPELMEAVDKYVTRKSIDIRVECVKGEQKTAAYITMDISTPVFNKMVEIVILPHNGLSDLEWLKQKGPNEFEEFYPSLEKKFSELQETGGYDRIDYDGSFPYQVYENI
jgi:hypothetical protein